MKVRMTVLVFVCCLALLAGGVATTVIHAQGNTGDIDYVTISDAEGVVEMEIPAAWDEVDERPWVIGDEEIGTILTAGPDIKALTLAALSVPSLLNGSVPGLLLLYAPEPARDVAADVMLDKTSSPLYSAVCGASVRTPVEFGNWRGYMDTWSKCGQSDNQVFVFALIPTGQGDLVILHLYPGTDVDEDTLVHHILETLQVKSSVGSGSNYSLTSSDIHYVTISDADGEVELKIPAAWDEVGERPLVFNDKEFGTVLTVGPDIKALTLDGSVPATLDGSVPGMRLTYMPDWASHADKVLDDSVPLYSIFCGASVRLPMKFANVQGDMDVWSKCGQSDDQVLVLALIPTGQDDLVFLEVYPGTDVDSIPRIHHILDTLQVKAKPDSIATTHNDGVTIRPTTISEHPADSKDNNQNGGSITVTGPDRNRYVGSDSNGCVSIYLPEVDYSYVSCD